MALTAAMYNHMKCINKWKREDIDLILSQGDSNHHRFREVFRFSDNKDDRVALSDIPEIFTMHVKETKAVGLKLGDWAGPVSSKMSGYNEEFRKFCPTLMDVLRENLKTNRPVIATIAVFTLAFIKVGSKIWLFDSHERDSRGNNAILNGKAFAAPFSSLQQIEEYLVKIYGKNAFFNAFSLKLWIPEEYVKSDEAIIKNIEHQLYVSASYKQCKGKMVSTTSSYGQCAKGKGEYHQKMC